MSEASALSQEEKIRHLWAHHEKPARRWFRTPSTLISIAALVASLGISIYGIVDARIVREKERVDDEVAEIEGTNQVSLGRLGRLREIVVLVNSLRKDASKLGRSPRDMEASKLVFSERQLLLDESDLLLSDPIVEQRVSPSLVTSLGFEHQSDGRWGKARLLFGQALKQAIRKEDSTAEAVAHRSIASLLAISGTGIQDLTASRESWKKALDVVDADDEIGLATDAQTLEGWANAEAWAGHVDRAEELLAQSRVEYGKLHVLNQLRYVGPDLVDEASDYYLDPGATYIPRLPASLIGAWTIRYPGQEGKHALVYLSRAQNSVVYDAFVSVYNHARLVEKRRGILFAIGDGEMLFDWGLQTSKGTRFGRMLTPGAGTTKLKLVRDGGLSLHGDDQRLGSSSEQVVWER